MAQTAEKLSDFYDHVKNYFSISQKEIDELSPEVKENLPKELGPLKRPLLSVKEFMTKKSRDEQDILVKIIGLSPLFSYTSKKGKGYYQRILGADKTGEIEFTTFQIKKFELGEVVRVSGIHMTEYKEKETVKISRNGGIFKVPFNLPHSSVSPPVLTPDSINYSQLPETHVTLKTILIEKGKLENRKEKFNEGSYSSMRIVVCAKEKKLTVYLQRSLAADVAKNVNEDDVLLLTNIMLKASRGQIVGYSSHYTSYQTKSVANYYPPDDLEFLFIPIQKMDLVTLMENSFLIGKVKGILSEPVKFDGKYGEYYASGFVDDSGSGSISFNKETLNLVPKFADSYQQVSIEGLIHSKRDYFKLDQLRGKIIKDKTAFDPATISGAEVLNMEGLFCITGTVIEFYEAKEYTTKDGRTDTMQRVRFDCQGYHYNITGFNQPDRAKLYELKKNNSYLIFFVRKEIYNDFISLRLSAFTQFKLLEENIQTESTNSSEEEYLDEEYDEYADEVYSNDDIEEEEPESLDTDFL